MNDNLSGNVTTGNAPVNTQPAAAQAGAYTGAYTQQPAAPQAGTYAGTYTQQPAAAQAGTYTGTYTQQPAAAQQGTYTQPTVYYNPQTGAAYQMQPNMGCYTGQPMMNRASEYDHEKMKKAFGGLCIASLIYAANLVLCIYKNAEGLFTIGWVASLIALLCYSIHIFNRRMKKDSIFILAIMGAIGCSFFLTGDHTVHFLNYCGEVLLCVTFLIHNFSDETGWSFNKHLGELFIGIFGPIGRINKPFSDSSLYFKSHQSGRSGKSKSIIVGILIAVPVVAILMAILASADLVFSDMIRKIFEDFSFADVFGILFVAALGFFSAYCMIRHHELRDPYVKAGQPRNANPVTALIITIPISLLYLGFCAIQVVYLFMGRMSLPEDVTYAEYAREGFFELLFVCVINLFMVILMKALFRKNRILDVVLLVISLCTYVMIASSTMRMIMYIKAYALSRLRIFVLVALVILALLMIGVIAMIFTEKFGFFKYCVIVTGIVYVMFAYSHEDYFIAKYNLQMENPDTYYVCNELSTDAASVIDEYIDNGVIKQRQKEQYLRLIEEDVEKESFRTFNVSHYMARKYFH